MEMNTIQRLADARNCLEGKIVAVVLSVLMALSFLNVSVFADTALATEGFDGEVGEKAVEPMDAPTAPEGAPTPANGDAGETPGNETPDPDKKDEGVVTPSVPDGLQKDAATLTVDTDGMTVELTAAATLPEGAQLTVDVAGSEESKAAMETALDDGQRLLGIYRFGLVDASGDPLTLSGMSYRVTVTWDSMFANDKKVYRIDGSDRVAPMTLETPLTTQGSINPSSLTFSTELLNALFAFVAPAVDEEESDGPSEPADLTDPEQPTIPADENVGNGDGDNARND